MYNHAETLARIKDLKKKSSITNEMLALKTQMSLSTVSKILSNEAKDPQLSNIIKIADALEVSVNYILYGVFVPEDYNSELFKEKLIQCYNGLNSTAKSKLLNYAEDLSKIEEYKA